MTQSLLRKVVLLMVWMVLAIMPQQADAIATSSFFPGETSGYQEASGARARYYDPVSGRFLSGDPLGHGSSMSLYDFANGDPVNQFDADGRFGKGVINWLSSDEFNNNSGGVAFAGLAMVLSLDFSTPDPTDVLPQKWGAYAVGVFGTVATAATLSQWEYIFNQTNGDAVDDRFGAPASQSDSDVNSNEVFNEGENLINQMDAHILKIINSGYTGGSPDPNDPDQDPVEHWKKEIKNFVNQMKQKLKRMPKNKVKRKSLEEAIKRGESQLKSWE